MPLGTSGDVGERDAGVQWRQVRDAVAESPTIHRTALTTGNSWAQNVKRARLRNLAWTKCKGEHRRLSLTGGLEGFEGEEALTLILKVGTVSGNLVGLGGVVQELGSPGRNGRGRGRKSLPASCSIWWQDRTLEE